LKRINFNAQNLHFFRLAEEAKIRFIVIKFSLIVFFLCTLSIVTESYAATEIYVVRHAETVGNATRKHTHENDRTFSSKGQKQVIALTLKLDKLQFDSIIVSPKYRTLNTIFPYLRKHHLVAEIWPELEECCWQRNSQIYASTLHRGSIIRLERSMRKYFIFPNTESQRTYNTQDYSTGLLQIFKAIQLIRKRFSGSEKRILIVAHYHLGSRLIEILQGIEPNGRYKLSNAKITHLSEKSNGTFHLISMNE